MKSDDDELLGCLGAAVLLIVVLIAGIVSQGWAIKVLWGWFAAPTFSLPELTLAQAYGVALVFLAIRGYQITPKQDSSGDLTKALISSISAAILYPALLVGVGAIIRALV